MSDKHDGPVEVAAILLFVQAAIATALATEAVGAAILFGGASAVSALLTVAGAVTTYVLVSRILKRRRSARRWVMAFQIGWITMALLDMGLALALAGRGLTLVGFVTRMVLPAAIFWLMRRPASRAAFAAASLDADEASPELEVVAA